MSKILLFFLTSIFLLLSFTSVEKEVYICKGSKSKKYHYSKRCRGLKRCSTKIYKVSLKEAKKKKRTLCGYED